MEAHFELKSSLDGILLTLWGVGELDFAARQPLLDAALPALAVGQTVVLDLKKVTFIDASALGAIAVCANAATHSGARFTIRQAWGLVGNLLQMTGLDHLIDEQA